MAPTRKIHRISATFDCAPSKKINGHDTTIHPMVPPMRTSPKSFAGSLRLANASEFVTEMVGRTADRAVQIHGGAGYMSEYKVERFYREVRLLRLYEGTSQILQLVIAKGLKAHGLSPPGP